MSMSPWAEPVQQILNTQAVTKEKGLSQLEAEKRLQEIGKNSFNFKNKRTKWHILWKQFKSPVVYILIIAATIAFALEEILDGSAILAIVILNVLVSYIQEAKAEASVEALAALTAPKAKVLRDGKMLEIHSELIVPGDILIFEAGDYISADSRIIMARQLSAQEAVLTGESMPVKKVTGPVDAGALLGDRTNMLFAGTAISTGTGQAVVTATGKETEIGKIAQMMATSKTSSTPMQQRLEIVGQNLLWAGIAVIVLVALIGIGRGQPWMEILMSSLSLSIAAIPEGLPSVVTIALVMAVKRMSHKRALVRKMDSVETLGVTDVICTDKTGTLTTGKMVVRDTYVHLPQGKEHLFFNMILCNNASITGTAIGDTTEISLLEHAHCSGLDESEIRQHYPRLFEWSFDSDRKLMSVAARINEDIFIFTKGAPEAIIPRCQLSQEERTKITDKVSEYSRKGMRVLGYARRKISLESLSDLAASEAEANLEFQGLTAMADPPRPESLESIKKCQDSGIRVIMITGDHPQTAIAIAHELGITNSSDDRVITGKDLESFDERTLQDCAEKVSVYARVSPSHKLKLVTALKANGHIVAMTGDGVNDAPALKIASIGVSMGKGGTEVARQASSMILTDDNFATIVDAVEEGRAVNGNIKRTLQYLLSTNLAELLFILTATALGWPVPLLPVNLLWLNLVTDGLPSLALAAEVVPPAYLENNHRPSATTFFDRPFYREMIIVGIIITSMCLGVYYYGLTHFDLLTARSYAFSMLVYAVLIRSFACRSEKKTFFELKLNYYHLLSVLVPVILQIMIHKNETLSEIFKVRELPLSTHAILLTLGCIPVTIVELHKLWRRRYS